MQDKLHILIVSSNPEICRELESALARCDVAACSVSCLREARAALKQQAPSLVFCEARLSDGDFHDILQATKLASCKVPVVVVSGMTDSPDYGDFLDAMRIGAFDFIVFPYRRSEIVLIARYAAHMVSAREEAVCCS